MHINITYKWLSYCLTMYLAELIPMIRATTGAVLVQAARAVWLRGRVRGGEGWETCVCVAVCVCVCLWCAVCVRCCCVCVCVCISATHTTPAHRGRGETGTGQLAGQVSPASAARQQADNAHNVSNLYFYIYIWYDIIYNTYTCSM